ncbi:MAG: signal peptidase I [Candidatus Aenigmarchaeota archaeon]|nr:signal peptidase I [Candidatus Aenigmarchaeota archaeon]
MPIAKTWKKYKKRWDKFTSGWFGTIVYLFLGFVIAYAVNTGLSNLLNTETPVVAVFSNSMVPTFYKGDMIIVQKVPEFVVGDIIVFSVSDRPYPIIHRIIEITQDGIRTKGDNNLYEDPWLTSQKNVYGKAILKFPLLGWVKILFVEFTGLA